MAILKLNPLVAGITGPVGGTVFKRTRAGPVVQRHASVRQGSTTAQLAIRNALALAAANWRSVSQVVRTAWMRYAMILKNTFRPDRLPGLKNGYNCFVAFNVPNVALGGVIQQAAPAVVGFNRPFLDIITQGYIGHFDVLWQNDPLYAGDFALLYVGLPYPKSQTNPRHWTWMTIRRVGPLSVSQQFALPRPLNPNTYIRYTLVRHSIALMDSYPRIIRKQFPA